MSELPEDAQEVITAADALMRRWHHPWPKEPLGDFLDRLQRALDRLHTSEAA